MHLSSICIIVETEKFQQSGGILFLFMLVYSYMGPTVLKPWPHVVNVHKDDSALSQLRKIIT